MSALVLAEGASKHLDINVTVWDWLIMTVSIPLVCIIIDIIANHGMRPPSIRKATILSFMWIGVSLLVGAAILFRFGGDAAAQYFSGYIAEKGLSFDNVFAWSVLFAQFRIYRGYHTRLMLVGIIISIIVRIGLMVGFGVAIDKLWWFTPILFLALLALGAKLAFSTEEEPDESQDATEGKLYKRLARNMDVAEDAYGASFLTKQEGRGWIRLFGRRVIPLPFGAKFTFFAVVSVVFFFVNTSFSFDSLPVVLAVSSVLFLIITPNIMGLLGLTSLYFLYDAISDKFHKLGTVLPWVLVFMGLKGAAGFDWRHFGINFSGYELSPMLSVGVILAIVAGGILWSIASPPAPEEEHEPISMDRDLDRMTV